MTEEQQRLFDRIANQCPEVVELRQIALAFRAALTGGDAAKLRLWIEGTRHCEYGAVVRFAYGLRKDLLAVSAAVETSWSTGRVEGQINRLKTIKRQMYGRAVSNCCGRACCRTRQRAPREPHPELHQNCGRANFHLALTRHRSTL